MQIASSMIAYSSAWQTCKFYDSPYTYSSGTQREPLGSLRGEFLMVVMKFVPGRNWGGKAVGKKLKLLFVSVYSTRARPLYRHTDIYRPIWQHCRCIQSAKFCRYVSTIFAHKSVELLLCMEHSETQAAATSLPWLINTNALVLFLAHKNLHA